MIVGIWDDDRMPIDAAGNRAEIITSSNSTVGRSNWGRSFVPYFAGTARDVRNRLLAMSGLTKITEEAISLLDDGLFTELYNTLLLFYAIVSPRQFYWYNQKVVSKEKRVEHMYWCLKEVIRIYMSVDNPINDIDAVCHLEKHFPQTFGPLKYKTFSGREVITEDPVRICPMYFLLLEKIADDGSSANFGKLQHHGILASQTKSEKYSQNFRHVHTRNTGEAEARLITFYANSIEAIAELHDRSNNPETMKTMANRLLRDPTPTNIDEIIDRNVHQYDGTRPLQFFQHFAMTQGFEIFYITEEEAFKLGLSENFDAAV